MKAIIVDDERIMLMSFARQCRGVQGLEMIGSFQYTSGALEYAEQNPVDAAILDINMPEMSGIELAARLREIDPKIRIVYVSAYIDDLCRMDADYCIEKPYTREAIEKMVKALAAFKTEA